MPSHAQRPLGYLCSLALLLAVAAQAQTTGSIKIGVVGPFTGPSSDFGTNMLQGVQLAVEEVNAVGGYMGRPIELVVKDDQGKPDEGLKVSKELIAESVVATVGFCNTGVAQKSLEVFQNAAIPLVIPCATGTPLTAKYPAPTSYIFRTSARDAIQAPFMVDSIVHKGLKKVAIFADTTGYGEAGLKDVVAALEAKKLQPVHVVRFDLGVKNLGTELKAARDAGADVIIAYTVGVENAVIANGRKELKWSVPLVGPWTLSFPFFIHGAKDAAEGAQMVQTFIAEPNTERRASFLTGYRRKFNQALGVPMAAAQAYDSVYLLTYSLFGIRDGKITGSAVKQSLENIPKTYYGVVTTYDHPFTVNDKDAITTNMLVMGKVASGVVTYANAEDARRSAIVKRKQ